MGGKEAQHSSGLELRFEGSMGRRGIVQELKRLGEELLVTWKVLGRGEAEMGVG